MIKIEKGVKVPDKAGTKYPWAEMEVGDSFEITEGDLAKRQSALAASSRSWAVYSKSEAKFRTHKTDTSVRIWRIK